MPGETVGIYITNNNTTDRMAYTNGWDTYSNGDLIFEGGIQKMNAVISNTAEFGEYYNGPKIIGPEVKEKMKESLKLIEDGTFAKVWLEENAKGKPNLLAKRKALGDHPIEIVGKKIRALFEKQ